MNDGLPGAMAVERLVRSLETAATTQERLALLISIAEGVSSIDARRALAYAQEAQELAAQLGDARSGAESLYVQGQCAHLLLDHSMALDAYNRALAAFEEADDDDAVAKTLREISFVHDALGDSSRALDYQFRALAIDQRKGSDASRAATLRMIGVVYSRTGDAASGLDFYRRSLALCTAPADAVERGKTLNNIGINLKNLGQLDEAEAALGEAYDVFVGLGLPLLQCATLNNVALVRERKGDVVTAERTMHDALALSEATGYRYGVAHASLSLGRLCQRGGRAEEARKWLTDALDVSERHNLKHMQFEVHEALAEHYEQCGDPASALRHFRKYHEIERAVQSDAARDKVRALQIQFELAAARRETEIERERHEALTRANAELDALNISLTEANLQKTMLLDQLERQTYEDALTGLANRRRLDQRLADEFALALRHGRPLAVAMADLDHFKAVNDRFSHAVGDAALRATAKILASQVRHTDLVARFGGEEFVVLLVETDLEAAQRVCEKLREAVAQHNWSAIHPSLSLTISIGVTADTSVPTHDRMLAAADRNLYAAKAAGRNRVKG
ncbi:MAG: diguanylate cyclase [Burkholderiales bacterium]